MPSDACADGPINLLINIEPDPIAVAQNRPPASAIFPGSDASRIGKAGWVSNRLYLPTNNARRSGSAATFCRFILTSSKGDDGTLRAGSRLVICVYEIPLSAISGLTIVSGITAIAGMPETVLIAKGGQRLVGINAENPPVPFGPNAGGPGHIPRVPAAAKYCSAAGSRNFPGSPQ